MNNNELIWYDILEMTNLKEAVGSLEFFMKLKESNWTLKAVNTNECYFLLCYEINQHDWCEVLLICW